MVFMVTSCRAPSWPQLLHGMPHGAWGAPTPTHRMHGPCMTAHVRETETESRKEQEGEQGSASGSKCTAQHENIRLANERLASDPLTSGLALDLSQPVSSTHAHVLYSASFPHTFPRMVVAPCTTWSACYWTLQYIMTSIRFSFSWSHFCGHTSQGVRKPSPEAYGRVISHLGVDPSHLLFIDDRQVNIDAAVAAGIPSVRFTGATALEVLLREQYGIAL